MTTEVQEPTHPALAAYLEQREARVRPAPRRVPPVPRAPVPRAPAPLRVAPGRLRDGIVAGAGGVALLWGVQAEPSARLDAFFAGGAHLTGLLAGYGVLVMLLLMARVPAVEHGVGADRLARWHALGGRYVLGLVGAHAVLALCGYAVHTRTDLVTAAGALLSYPALAAATAGTALLVAVGVTSARAARRRLRHETWRAVHLLSHLAAALGFVHQLAGTSPEACSRSGAGRWPTPPWPSSSSGTGSSSPSGRPSATPSG